MLNNDHKTLLVLSGESSGVSLCSFSTITGTPVRIESANISLVIFMTVVIVKMFSKQWEGKNAYKDCFISQKQVEQYLSQNNI